MKKERKEKGGGGGGQYVAQIRKRTRWVKFSVALRPVHRDHIEDCWGRETQDGHLDFHTASELWTRWDSISIYLF